ncbi:hypothetical protein KQI30_08395 [Clostridium bornimense]|uniref:hypothetical protein n=1 Tax=Clostridium bornimense TaxID=1216932 RepID=UPI001C10F059|nr:hypothetical protein [Clostridium bornimense]MBU5316288.1 hypothetical protein [Clostridium bornimense]
MKLDFLDAQKERMKKIGAYSLLFRNSIAKRTWDKFGFTEGYEQDNLIISVLLFIMEQSLKEELCTIDDIALFIDEINSLYYKKQITYDDSREIAEFIVNVILCNEGKAMYFKAMDYKIGEYEEINISFLKNKVEYVDDVRRVSYYVSDEGYELILATLEVEESLKITIQEIIFKMHLQKASYDKAVTDVKNIFKSMRSKIHKMQDDIRKIKESPLMFSVKEYKAVTEGNLEILRDCSKKFMLHKEAIEIKIKEFEDKEINIDDLTEKEEENLKNLRIINEYIGKAIDEEQRVLITHYDLKNIYRNELENISKMALIERFDIKREVYDKVLENPDLLESINIFLNPLFLKSPLKGYNLNKAFTFQNKIKDVSREDDEKFELLEDNEEEVRNKRKIERILKCNDILKVILESALENGRISLLELIDLCDENKEVREKFIPNVEIFREVMVEMIKVRNINIDELIEERKTFIDNGEIEFQLNKSILNIVDENAHLKNIKFIRINKIDENKEVKIKNVVDENGNYKNLLCSDLLFEVLGKGDREVELYNR